MPGPLALVGGGEWRPRVRASTRAAGGERRAARCSCCPRRPPTSTPTGPSRAPSAGSTTSAPPCARCRVLTRRDAVDEANVGPDRATPLHLPVGRHPHAPALGAEGLARVGRARRRLAGRRGARRVRLPAPWCCATRWSTHAAARSPLGLGPPRAAGGHPAPRHLERGQGEAHAAHRARRPPHRRRRRAHRADPRRPTAPGGRPGPGRSSSTSTAPRPTSPRCPDPEWAVRAMDRARVEPGRCGQTEHPASRR